MMTWLIVGEGGKARNGVSSILFLLLFLARVFFPVYFRRKKMYRI